MIPDAAVSLLDTDSVVVFFETPPKRIVSLVPSMTESLFDLSVGDRVVGVTDFCRPPDDLLPRVGGTKSPSINDIRRLTPDLVIASQEENNRESIEALQEAGLNIWLTFPRSTMDVLNLLWAIVNLFKLSDQAEQVETLARTLDWTEKATTGRLAIPTFAPIWMDEKESVGPWMMTFNFQTYMSDVLAKCGGMNVFSGRMRRYPLDADLGQADPEDAGDRDTRYPRVTLEEIRQTAPEIILLPSEPYEFGEDDVPKIKEWLADTPAVRDDKVHLIDGSLLTWPGTRLARALADLPPYLRL